MNKVESQAYLFNNTTKELKIIDKRELLNTLRVNSPKNETLSYKDIVNTFYFNKMKGVEIYFNAVPNSADKVLISFNKTYEQVAKIVMAKPKKVYDREYISGEKYRVRDITEVLNKNIDRITLKLPITLELEYFVKGGKESELDKNRYSDALLDLDVNKTNWTFIEEKIRKELFAQLQKMAKVKLSDMYVGGHNMFEVPTSMHIK